MKIAVIDIGSNSVRLMLWADGTLYKKVKTTRLGEGIAYSSMLKEEAMERTVVAIKEFAVQAKQDGAEQIYVFATAAVRSSDNGSVFCERVKRACSLEVDVVSGEKEAELGLYGAIGNAENGGIIDIGGASTEVCYRDSGKTAFRCSLSVGAVRLFDLCGQNRAKTEEEIGRRIFPLQGNFNGKMYAIGGTVTTLACLKLALRQYDGDKVQGCVLTQEGVGRLTDVLFSLSVEERKRLVGMDVRRADVIAGATLLLHQIMKKLSLQSITVSDRDNMEGYLALKGIV